MSTLRANTISNAAGTGPAALTAQWAARATVTYDQVTPTIDASNNISSVTDTAAGNWEQNLTNAMADALYTINGWSRYVADVSFVGLNSSGLSDTKSTSVTEFRTCASTNATAGDMPDNGVTLYGDLA